MAATLTALLCVSALCSSVALDVGTLRLPAGSPSFNPAHLGTKQLLMRELRVSAMDIKVLSANVGLNGGVWVLSDPRRGWGDMVLKLRQVEPELPSFPGEARHYVNLARMHPGLERDPDVVIPSRILSCLDAYGSKLGDLILMRKAPGTTLSRLIFDKYWDGHSESEEFMAIFESVGRQLRALHSRYGKQHCDFHSANIMVDAADRNRITFIDLGGMGLPITDDDVRHLITDLRGQASSYSSGTFLERGILRFERGYANVPAVQTPVPQRSPIQAAAAPRAQAAAQRAPEAAPLATGQKVRLPHSSASGVEVLWTVIMDVDEALEWQHLLMGMMVLAFTPAALHMLRRKPLPSSDAPRW